MIVYEKWVNWMIKVWHRRKGKLVIMLLIMARMHCYSSFILVSTNNNGDCIIMTSYVFSWDLSPFLVPFLLWNVVANK